MMKKKQADEVSGGEVVPAQVSSVRDSLQMEGAEDRENSAGVESYAEGGRTYRSLLNLNQSKENESFTSSSRSN